VADARPPLVAPSIGNAFQGNLGFMTLAREARMYEISRTAFIGAVAILACEHAFAAAPNARVLESARACEPQARALLQQLVQIDSGTANVAGLDRMSAALRPELERLGATIKRVPSTAPGLADSVLATWTGTGRGRILLIAHMDTVFLPGAASELPYRVAGDRGIGPGAGDDKQGIVTALCALQALQQTDFRDYARIALLLNSNEETGSTGSSELILAQAAASDVVINLERGVPPDGVVVSRKGSAKATIEVSGRAAHSGLEPEKGRNAVVEAAHQVLQVASLADATKETSVHVTLISGGTASNVIPDRATITVDVRAFSSAEFDRVEAGLRRIANTLTVPDVKVTTSLERGFPPWPRAASTDALLARATRIYAEIGRSLAAVVVGSSADVALAATTGTPSIDGFGSLGGGAHGVDDHVDLTSIVPRTYLLARMLMDIGHEPPAPSASERAALEQQRNELNKKPDTAGTGAFPAMKEEIPALPRHVIYRPTGLTGMGKTKLGVVAWGNGGCSDDAASSRFHLLELASHGYLVIAAGRILSGPGAPPQAPRAPTAPGQPLVPRTVAADLTAAIDWALAENSRTGSPYFRRIDSRQIAVSGFSCGGLQALTSARDPRVTAVVLQNTGIFIGAPSTIPGMDVSKDALKAFHTPVLYILGGPTDIAYANGMDDFKQIQHVPVAVANLPVGHGGTYNEPNGGAAAQVAVDWLNWQLRGDGRAARRFMGDGCGLCNDARWTFERKNFPKAR
jgi:glutamate carboxypeptidase